MHSQSSKSEEQKRGDGGNKWLEVQPLQSLAAAVQKPRKQVTVQDGVHRDGQGVQIITVIKTTQDTCQRYLLAFVMLTGAEGFEFICPYG